MDSNSVTVVLIYLYMLQRFNEERKSKSRIYESHWISQQAWFECIVLKQEAEGWSIYVALPTVMLRCSLMTLTTDSDVDGITAVTVCGLAPVNTWIRTLDCLHFTGRGRLSTPTRGAVRQFQSEDTLYILISYTCEIYLFQFLKWLMN